MEVPRFTILSRGTLPAAAIFLLAVSCTSVVAQPEQPPQQRRDSAIVIRPISPDSLPSSLEFTNGAAPFHQSKSPWLAVGMSAILPGSGQIYNADYWKAPVIWGLAGYWIYEWTKLNNLYQDRRILYEESVAASPPNGNPTYQDHRDFYRNERDKFAWFMGALYMVNLVDAYVGAHLYDFDVSGDLGLDGRIEPKVMATVHLRF